MNVFNVMHTNVYIQTEIHVVNEDDRFLFALFCMRDFIDGNNIISLFYMENLNEYSHFLL